MENNTEIKPKEIINSFRACFETDEESWEKKGSRLLKKYKNGDMESKKNMDDIFITLCGYSFETLLEGAKAASEVYYQPEQDYFNNPDAKYNDSMVWRSFEKCQQECQGYAVESYSGDDIENRVYVDADTEINISKHPESTPAKIVSQDKAKQAVADLLSQYSVEDILEGDWWVGSSVPIEGVSEYGIDVNVFVYDEEDPDSPYSIVAYPLIPSVLEDGNFTADVSELIFSHSVSKSELPFWIVSEKFANTEKTIEDAVAGLPKKNTINKDMVV